MPNYIRSRKAGGTYFFTARLQDRSSDLLVREIDRLRQAFRETRERKPFQVEAIVVLPAAIHTIWALPEGDADFSARWGLIKSLFSRGLEPGTGRSTSQIMRGEKGLWQRRFWEHLIRDRADFEEHLHMIHSAPVHAGLVPRPEDWPWTSLHRDRRVGRVVAPPLRPPVGYGAGPARRKVS